MGRYGEDLRASRRKELSAETLCTLCCALWRSAERCHVLYIHGEAIQLLVFKNPFTKLENLINICVS